MVKWHKTNPEERIYVPLKDGKKAPMPRYLKEKIYDVYDKEKIAYHWKIKNDLLKDKEFLDHGTNLQSFKEQQYFHGERKLKKIETLKI